MTNVRPTRASLVQRVLVRDLADEGMLKRIAFMSGPGDETWLMNLEGTTWPYVVSTSQFLAEYDSETPRYEIEFDEPYLSFCAPSERRTRTDVRQEALWSIIEYLIDSDERPLFFRATRARLINGAVIKFGVTRQTVTSNLMRYWQRGMTFDALRPDFRKCGAPGVPRNILSGAKAGRPRVFTTGTGVSVNEQLRRCLQVGADYYLSPRRPSQEDAVDYIVQKFYSSRVPRGDGVSDDIQVFPNRPTVRQLGYFLKTHYAYHKRFRARHGQKRWDLEGRALLGKGDHGTLGPGDKFQVDATVADVYLVSQFDRRRIVGRPVIYFVIDVWSRLIVGLYVGFEGPSWAGAMMALTNMVTPKVEFCKQYGIDIDLAEWPAHHAPKALLADRGELMSVGLAQPIVNSLRIQIENTSPGRADLKGIVERRFGVVPAIFKQFTSGYVESDFLERGAHDYRLDATLNLFEFTQMVVYAVNEHNREPISDLRLPPDMVTDGLTASPLDLWEWGIANRSGSLKVLTLEEVSLHVMPRDKARVTGKGIKFKGGYYSCDTAIRDEWFSRARRSEWSVDVSHDPRNLETLYLRSDKLARGFETCRLLPEYSDLIGKSLFESEELDRGRKQALAATVDSRQERRIETDISMEAIASGAKAAANAAKVTSLSKSQRLSSIRDNRADEKRAQRAVETIDLGPDPDRSPPPVAESVETYEAASLALLKRMKAARGGTTAND